MNNLFIIGIMGCGKTSVGKKAAELLGRNFFDVDEEIEKSQGMTIREIFRLHNEAYFRGIETEMLQKLTNEENAIISTGGGIVLRKENVLLMQEAGDIVWIMRPIEKIVQEVDTATRPLLMDGAVKLYEIFDKREILYRQYADFMVENSGSIEDAVQMLVSYLSK